MKVENETNKKANEELVVQVRILTENREREFTENEDNLKRKEKDLSALKKYHNDKKTAWELTNTKTTNDLKEEKMVNTSLKKQIDDLTLAAKKWEQRWNDSQREIVRLTTYSTALNNKSMEKETTSSESTLSDNEKNSNQPDKYESLYKREQAKVSEILERVKALQNANEDLKTKNANQTKSMAELNEKFAKTSQIVKKTEAERQINHAKELKGRDDKIKVLISEKQKLKNLLDESSKTHSVKTAATHISPVTVSNNPSRPSKLQLRPIQGNITHGKLKVPPLHIKLPVVSKPTTPKQLSSLSIEELPKMEKLIPSPKRQSKAHGSMSPAYQPDSSERFEQTVSNAEVAPRKRRHDIYRCTFPLF